MNGRVKKTFYKKLFKNIYFYEYKQLQNRENFGKYLKIYYSMLKIAIWTERDQMYSVFLIDIVL